MPAQHHGWCSKDSPPQSGWWIVAACSPQLKEEGEFHNPCVPGRTDVLGACRVSALGCRGRASLLALDSRCTIFECSLTCLRLDPFSGKLGTRTSGRRRPVRIFAAGSAARCCCRGGRALLRKAALDKSPQSIEDRAEGSWLKAASRPSLRRLSRGWPWGVVNGCGDFDLLRFTSTVNTGLVARWRTGWTRHANLLG
jgi:hypothetical protein